MAEPELLPELKPYLSTGGILHPLVKCHFFDPSQTAACNEQYLTKIAGLTRCRECGDWEQFVWLYQRPYRLEAFAAIAGNLSDEEYWSLLASLWRDSENLWQDAPLLGRLVDASRPSREAMMNEQEREFLARLPYQFTLYRGAPAGRPPGMSWTLSCWKARWFAQRTLASRSGVTQGVADKRDVVAVLLGRGSSK